MRRDSFGASYENIGAQCFARDSQLVFYLYGSIRRDGARPIDYCPGRGLGNAEPIGQFYLCYPVQLAVPVKRLAAFLSSHDT